MNFYGMQFYYNGSHIFFCDLLLHWQLYFRCYKNTFYLFMNLRIAWKYSLYLLFARHRGGHGIHSPFVFDLLTNVIEKDEKQFYIFREIENVRSQLLCSKQKIKITDFGAGSSAMKGSIRKISDLVKYAAVQPKYGQLLFRLVNHFQPRIILELGTSLGFSSIYLAAANRKATVTTIEACSNIAKQAEHNFLFLKQQNITLLNQSFEEGLPTFLQKVPKLDFVFFDGNHRKQPTLNYFYLCLEKVHNDSILVFDDIHWSVEMEGAWNEIKKNEKVVVTIDLFQFGLVFFRKEMSKQNFVIKY